LDQPISVLLILAALFLVTLVWLFFLIVGRQTLEFKIDAFGIKINLNAHKGDLNEHSDIEQDTHP